MARAVPRRRSEVVTLDVGREERGQRLDQLLAARLPAALGRPLSRSTVRRLIVAGAVACDRRPIRQPATELRGGERLVVRVDLERLGPATAPTAPPALHRSALLHLDDWLVIVDKPPGVPTHATVDPARPNLVAMVGELLGRAGGEAPRLGIHHRLDRDTSGPVLFTLDPAVNAAVGAEFAEGRVEKRYWAVCGVGRVGGGAPPPQGEVRDHLGVVGRAGKRARYGAVRAGGRPAHTSFRRHRVLDGRTWLVEARPHTGRTHQVRVHLAGVGLPIVGDDLYGGRPGPRVLLHCRELALPHPVTGAELRVQAEPPADWPARDG